MLVSELKGSFSETKKRPKFINIRDRAEKCLKHFTEIVDREHMYVPYMGATLGDNPPHFVHHKLDWSEVLPYGIYGMIAARNITGTDLGMDVQLEQRRLLLKAFDNLDGLSYSSTSPWSKRYSASLWEQGRAMVALLAWFLDTGEEKVLDYVYRMVDALWDMSYQYGTKRYFKNHVLRYSSGSLIEGLMKFYELTAYEKAVQLARGLYNVFADPEEGFYAPDGSFNSFFRFPVAPMSGMARYAVFSGEQKNIKRAKDIYDFSVGSCTSFGSTPCTEPVCSDMEIIAAALDFIKDGQNDCWDQIDRFFRNHIVECQFLDPSEWVEEKAFKGRQTGHRWVNGDYPDDLQILPYDDYNDVVNRCVGGFIWASATEHRFIPSSVMLCCSGHGMWIFNKITTNMIMEKNGHLEVNLSYNYENSLAEVISFEPYTGKTVVIPKKNYKTVKVRVPAYVDTSKVECFIDGQRKETKVSGGVACFEGAEAGKEYTVVYPLRTSTTIEIQQDMSDHVSHPPISPVGGEFQVRWRGNTVIEIQPTADEEKRMYKRRSLDTDQTAYEDHTYYIPEKDIKW